MSGIEQLFVEYTRRRKRGLESQQVIHDLRAQIKALPDLQKQSLKLRIRKWEENYMPVPAGPDTPPLPVPSPQPAIRKVKFETPAKADEPEIVDVFCHFCGRINRVGEVMCHACGRLLDLSQQIDQSTRILRQTGELAYSDEFFGDDFVLSLKVRGSSEADQQNVYEIRPQDADREVTIGRSAYGSEVAPDIDLSEHNAEGRGVSRIHLSLRYDPGEHVLHVADLGSANGTFVNGQRLHRNESRVLRNGDELRLGKLVMNVKFFTYDFG